MRRPNAARAVSGRRENDILPFDDEAAAEYGKICASLRRQGTPIGAMDMLIAAHAKAKGLIIVTNNVLEFERVEGLGLGNWVSA